MSKQSKTVPKCEAIWLDPLYLCSLAVQELHFSVSNVEGERTRGIVTRWNTFNRGLTDAGSRS